MKKSILILAMVLLASVSHGRDLSQERALQQRIKDVINRVVDIQKWPDPNLNPKAARVARNSYRNQSKPVYPKTIYRFPVRPPHRNSYRSFFGGIPRGG